MSTFYSQFSHPVGLWVRACGTQSFLSVSIDFRKRLERAR